MKRRAFLAALASAAVAEPIAAVGQQPARPPRVGLLMGSSPSVEAATLGAFRQALTEAGFSDGQTIILEVRYAEGQPDRFRSLARELVALAPSVIACVGSKETAALQAATRTIPIVFIQAPNPVELGLVTSLARPGGNTTGFAQMSAELDEKRLELLHEIVPSLTHAAFLINPLFLPGIEQRFVDAEKAAKSLGIALQRVAATAPAELTAALAAVREASSQALLVQNDPMLAGTERSRVLDFGSAHRVPTVWEQQFMVANGGLFSYGIDHIENARLAAGYVARILQGAEPADLPVQRPTKFELVINRKTAETLGLTIPPSILARADEVIE